MACDLTSLDSEACTNGFKQAAQNETQYRALVLSMLCVGFDTGEFGILGELGIPIYGEDGVGPIFFQ